MSRKTRKLIWSAPLVVVLAVAGALAMFVALTPNGVLAHDLPGAPGDVTATADGPTVIKVVGRPLPPVVRPRVTASTGRGTVTPGSSTRTTPVIRTPVLPTINWNPRRRTTTGFSRLTPPVRAPWPRMTLRQPWLRERRRAPTVERHGYGSE